ncbi:hypothetical protein CG719_27090 [Streptomyces sp. CB01373]|nr:hypothetical protein CG719_27090 [Streptomyces sp. CB01373]
MPFVPVPFVSMPFASMPFMVNQSARARPLIRRRVPRPGLSCHCSDLAGGQVGRRSPSARA